MPAVLFGSIGTIADTSELQRRAFNDAFEIHELGWHWERKVYSDMLRESGGSARIAAYAAARGEQVDAAAVHRTKSDLFRKMLAAEEVVPRAGVVDTIWDARNAGCKILLVSTTSCEIVSELLTSLRRTVDLPGFDSVVDSTLVERPKPDRAAYDLAMRTTRQRATRCVAIEDNMDGMAAASGAGLPCVAFPNENTLEHDFDAAVARVERLEFGSLRKFTDPT